MSTKQKILISAVFLAFVFFVFGQSAFSQQVSLSTWFLDNFQNGGSNANSAKLLLINETSFDPGQNNIGDIVGVFDGDQVFSPAEIEGFDIVTVRGVTREQAEAYMNSLLPVFTSQEQADSYTKPAFRFRVTNKDAMSLSSMVVSNVKRK